MTTTDVWLTAVLSFIVLATVALFFKEFLVITFDSVFAMVQAPPLRRGINQIVVLPGPNSIGRLSSTVTGLEVWVRYKQD